MSGCGRRKYGKYDVDVRRVVSEDMGKGGRGRGGSWGERGGLREEGSTTVAAGNGQLLRESNLLSSTFGPPYRPQTLGK